MNYEIPRFDHLPKPDGGFSLNSPTGIEFEASMFRRRLQGANQVTEITLRQAREAWRTEHHQTPRRIR